MIYIYSLLTLVAFIIGLKVSKKLGITLLNPFLIALTILISSLILFDISYQTYYQGNFPLNNFLGVSIVALALPFYEQLPKIRKKWKEIVLILIFGSVVTLLTGVGFAVLFGASQDILAAVLPKSVSVPIAIAISHEVDGNAAVAAVGVMIAGLTGSIFGLSLLRILKIRNHYAIGLSMGTVSHALGTGRSLEYSMKAGSYSSIALVACGVLSSIFAPLIFKVVVALCY
ncbi:LrgB family protein [Mannheimia sp. AT1]|uniref:LrgB family protein n=1 Tax=Mannheimia cairinae TaxID=3025936 RepID=A0ABT5MSL6_9PAST|nr:LrgB family protein [Mannheimia cairinae]MDD0824591.1 LrgB family protein [Mannheimia cairinae]MDD0826480.1 LrgB family protein [Mannheimia cairinae]